MALVAEKQQRACGALALGDWPGYDKIPPQLPVAEAYSGAARIVSALMDFSGELSGRFRAARLLPVQWAESLLGRAIQALRLNYNALLGVMMCTVDVSGRQAHGVHTALLSMLAACQWGLPAKSVRELGLAGLFYDAGGTASAGKAAARAQLLTGRACRERGTGRAAGCAGEKIALAPTILAIAHTYAALIRFSPGKSPLSPHEALAQMQGRHGSEYDNAALEHFIRCLGVYPVGGVVETQCGQRGLVIENNPDTPHVLTVRLLRPAAQRGAFGPEAARSWQAEQIATAYPLIAPAEEA